MQSGLSVSWKLYLNLCCQRWLSPSRSLVSSFTPIVGLMSLRIFYLKMLSVSEVQMLESNFFPLNYGWWKIWIFKKLVLLIHIGDILCISSSILIIWLWDYIKKKYFGHWFLYILKKRHRFWCQRLCLRDSRSRCSSKDIYDSWNCVIQYGFSFLVEELLKVLS